MSSTTGQDQAGRATKGALEQVLATLDEDLAEARRRARTCPRRDEMRYQGHVMALQRLRVRLALAMGTTTDPDAPVTVPPDVLALIKGVAPDYDVDLTA